MVMGVPQIRTKIYTEIDQKCSRGIAVYNFMHGHFNINNHIIQLFQIGKKLP